MLVCPSCFGRSKTLQSRFEEKGTKGECPTCGQEDAFVIEAVELTDLFNGFRDYYRPVVDRYRHGKMGYDLYTLGDDPEGRTLVERLREDWDVFSDRIEDGHAEEILREMWPWFFGPFWEDGPDGKEEVSDPWASLKKVLMHEWRFFHRGNEVQDCIDRALAPFLDDLKTPLSNWTWYRARKIRGPLWNTLSADDMGAPPPEKASAGRANPVGIPYLYVASDEQTAAAEIRAEPGERVAIAEVSIPDDWNLAVLDTTRRIRIEDPFEYRDLRQTRILDILVDVLSRELSRPVQATDSELEYVVTQFLCEYFRKEGFSGVVFESALAGGTNAVFFDPSIASMDEPVEKVVKSKIVRMVDPADY